jgi:hypothetical protein
MEEQMHANTPGEAAYQRAQQVERFKARTAEYLASRYPPEKLPAGRSWLELITDAIRLGNRKGIHSEDGVKTLAELHLVHGPSFHVDSEWAFDVLDASDAEEAERVARLRRHLPDSGR